jgi:4'-phosphopantetheinyl transferase
MPTWTPKQAEAADQLGSGDVHVWDIDLHSAPTDPTSLGMLDEEERARAAHLRNPTHSDEFLRAYVCMRILLGGYLKLEPSEVRFAKSQAGKPHLIQGAGESGLRFNLSRTDGRAALALTKGRDIGMDIERITDRGLSDVAARALAAPELAYFRALPEAEKRQAFFTIWARKEAFLKALGEGLAIAPVEVDTISTAGRIRLSKKRQRGWRVQDVKVADGYAAALVVKGFFRPRVQVHKFP